MQLLVLLLVALATAAPGPETKADAESYDGIGYGGYGLAAYSPVYGDLNSNLRLYYGKREASPQRSWPTTTTTTPETTPSVRTRLFGYGKREANP